MPMHFLRSLLRTPLLAVATALSVWVAEAAGPPPPVVWQGSIEVASGAGERGPWRQNESRYDFVDDPAVALGAAGDVAVVWVDQARKAVLFQRYSAAGEPQLSAPVDVSRAPRTFSWLPRVVLPPGEPRAVLVLWQEIIFTGGSHGGDILFARSDDGGRSFSQPLNLSANSMGGDGKGRINRQVWHNGSLDLAAAPGGALYAAWTEYDGALWFSRSANGGRHFSQPVRLAGSERLPARAPSLAVAPDGTVYLAWTTGETATASIQVASSTDGGASFSNARTAVPSTTYSDAPRLAVDAAGVVHLVYAQSTGGPFASYQVVYTRSTDKGGSFASPAAVSTPMPAPFQSAAFPYLAVGAQGRLAIAWELFEAPDARPRGLAIAVSSDGGQRFSAPLGVPGSTDPGGGFNGSTQGLLMNKLALGRDGRLVLANSSLQPGVRSRVWLTRGRLAD